MSVVVNRRSRLNNHRQQGRSKQRFWVLRLPPPPPCRSDGRIFSFFFSNLTLYLKRHLKLVEDWKAIDFAGWPANTATMHCRNVTSRPMKQRKLFVRAFVAVNSQARLMFCVYPTWLSIRFLSVLNLERPHRVQNTKVQPAQIKLTKSTNGRHRQADDIAVYFHCSPPPPKA